MVQAGAAQSGSPEDYETATRFVRPEDMRESVLISVDLSRMPRGWPSLAGIGFDAVFLHQVNLNRRGFIEAFAGRLLPRLK